MEKQYVSAVNADQLESEIPTKYSDICRLVGDLYIRISFMKSQYSEMIRSLKAQNSSLLKDNQVLRDRNEGNREEEDSK